MTKKYLWRTGLAIAVVGAASVGAIGIASASNDIPTRAAASDDEPGGRGPCGNPWHNRPFGHPWHNGLTDMLHGEVVVAKEGGGTQTVLVQKGTVTEVSATGVTVRSADGFTTAYVVDGDTKVRADSDEIADVAKEEEVVVMAPKSGDKNTATVVVDLTDLGWE
jgi:hypothetical protein